MAGDVESAGRAVARTRHHLAESFAFAATPMLLVDPDGKVCEVNHALAELTGRELAGAVGSDLDELARRLGPRASGPPLPAGLPRPPEAAGNAWRPGYDEIPVRETTFDYETREFGRARLRVVAVPMVDPSSGAYLGLVLNVEVRALADPERFDQALRNRWSRELMWIIYSVSYDRILNEMPFYVEVVDRHLAAIRGAGANRVLDLGAGTGNVAVPLLADGREVVAVDVSRSMLDRLKAKVDRSSDGRLTIILGTAERLPQLSEEGFDAVSALLSLFDMDEPDLALAEAVRLLRPGGVLAITEPKANFDMRPLLELGERHLREAGRFEELSEDWARINSVAPGLESRIRAKGPGSPGSTPWDAERLLERLRGLGFTELTFRDSHLGQCATVVGRKPRRRGV